jgi:NDP-sugar pyrophosphorylase family protein
MLAAGRATRAYPVGLLYPKVLFQICGLPVLEYMLTWFDASQEVSDVHLVLNDTWSDVIGRVECYLDYRRSHLVEIHGVFASLGIDVGSGHRPVAVDVVAAHGDGTGGDLRTALEAVGRSKSTEDFVVCNADYLTLAWTPTGHVTSAIPVDDIVAYHRRCRASLGTACTVGVIRVNGEDLSRFGNVELSEQGSATAVLSFREKPASRVLGDGWINAGVYVVSGDIVLPERDTYLPKGPDSALELTMLQRLSEQGLGRLAACRLRLRNWLDLATVGQLAAASLVVADLSQQAPQGSHSIGERRESSKI